MCRVFQLHQITNKMEKSAEKEIMSVNDLVEMLQLSKSAIYKLTFNRIIPFYKPAGKMMYFKRSEIMEWINRGRVEPANEVLSNHYLQTSA